MSAEVNWCGGGVDVVVGGDVCVGGVCIIVRGGDGGVVHCGEVVVSDKKIGFVSLCQKR